MAKHGTRNMYERYGCRCEECRKAEHEAYLNHPIAQTRKRRNATSEQVIDSIEADYLEGKSTIELGKKYSLHHTTISKLMRRRGHYRGRGGGAVKVNNEARREVAIAKIIAECGNVENTETLDHSSRRELLMASRKRDYGITWKSLARRNGSMKCEVCGIECDQNDKVYGSFGPTHPSVDHIVRICDGGEDTWENSRLTCMKCNLKLNAKANRKEVRA